MDLIIRSTFYGHPINKIHWLWSNALRPMDRFSGPNNSGVWVCGSWDCMFLYGINKLREHDMRSELLDPMWPCEYWRNMEEYRQEEDDNWI